MIDSSDLIAARVLLLIKLDATSLFRRIKNRQSTYLKILQIKRTREHFDEIFYTRYKDLKIEDLKLITDECLVAIDNFYNGVEEIEWYLGSTEDMPATVEDHLARSVRDLEVLYEMMMLYISAELGVEEDELVVQPADPIEE